MKCFGIVALTSLIVRWVLTSIIPSDIVTFIQLNAEISFLSAERRKKSRWKGFGNELILPYIEGVDFSGKRNRRKKWFVFIVRLQKVVFSMNRLLEISYRPYIFFVNFLQKLVWPLLLPFQVVSIHVINLPFILVLGAWSTFSF